MGLISIRIIECDRCGHREEISSGSEQEHRYHQVDDPLEQFDKYLCSPCLSSLQEIKAELEELRAKRLTQFWASKDYYVKTPKGRKKWWRI